LDFISAISAVNPVFDRFCVWSFLFQQDGLVLDVENLVRHYAFTLKGWTRNFERSISRLDGDLFDDRFKRMRQYYLECGTAAAVASAGALYQILFARNYPLPMPLQRV
jgi:cyclopropane fatty-acyl-phospholipid synthase-like methyltransferase